MQFVFVAYLVYWFAPFYCCIHFKTCIQRDPCQFIDECHLMNLFLAFFVAAVVVVLIRRCICHLHWISLSFCAHPFKSHSNCWHSLKIEINANDKEYYAREMAYQFEWNETEGLGTHTCTNKRIPKVLRQHLLGDLSRFVIIHDICVPFRWYAMSIDFTLTLSADWFNNNRV